MLEETTALKYIAKAHSVIIEKVLSSEIILYSWGLILHDDGSPREDRNNSITTFSLHRNNAIGYARSNGYSTIFACPLSESQYNFIKNETGASIKLLTFNLYTKDVINLRFREEDINDF